MTRIDALYEAAQKATPGPWSTSREGDTHFVHPTMANLEDIGPDAKASEDATYIALADPQTVMALVELYQAVASRAVLLNDLTPEEQTAIEKVEALDGCPDCGSTQYPKVRADGYGVTCAACGGRPNPTSGDRS